MMQLEGNNVLKVIFIVFLIEFSDCGEIPCEIPYFDCECRVADPPSSLVTPFSQFCPLVWEIMSSGDELPAKGIQSEPGGKLFAVRISRNAKYHVGSYDVVQRTAYFVNSQNESETADSFEILSNPYNCSTHWQEYVVGSKNEHKPKFTIPITKEVYMARYFNEDDETWIPGALVITGNGISTLDTIFGPVKNVTYPQILQSYSAGLELEVSNVVMAKENLFDVTGVDFMGVDEIRNDGSGTVELELNHFKQTVRHYGFAFNANISASIIASIKVTVATIDLIDQEIDIMRCDLGADFLPIFFKRTETVPVKVTRKVAIPPYAHIESCSIVKYVHNINVEFTARGRYLVKGWHGEEIKNLLLKEGIIFDYVGIDYVGLDMSGTFSFSLALNTKFFIGAFNTAPCWLLGTRNGISSMGNITKNLIVLPKDE